MPDRSEIEAAICKHLVRFSQDYLGMDPRKIQASLLPSLLVIRLQGMLSVAEQQLLLTSGTGNARDMIKQMRITLVEAAPPILVAMVQEIMTCNVVAVHHDLSTITGEEVFVFSFVEASPSRT